MNERSNGAKSFAAFVLRILLLGLLVAVKLPAGQLPVEKLPRAVWQIGLVDSSGGNYSSLRIDRYGNAHLAYVDSENAVLKYSFWDHNLQKWFTTSLDRSQGFCSLTLDSKQFPHISYLDYGTGKLKYAHWDGSTWQKAAIEISAKEISFYTSIALDSKDQPSISFYEYFSAGGDNDLHLRVVSWNGSMWELRTADNTRGSGKFNSIAVDSAGNPQVAYADVAYENSSLRYARWNGGSWHTAVLEGADGPKYMHSVSLLLDSKDIPHIAYTDAGTNQVKYATQRDGKWQFELVDSLEREAFPDRNGIALDEQGNPYISYCDAGRNEVRVAYRKDQKWMAEIVDKGVPCYTSSVQVAHGTIWVTYGAGSQGLKVARKNTGNPDAASQEQTVSQQRQPAP